MPLSVGDRNPQPVNLDQTTPGTTESVTVATGQGAGATIGTTADASVPTDAAGTLSGKMRGAVANLATTLARLGVATDAKSTQDAEASLHSKARAVVDLLFQVDAVLDSMNLRIPDALGVTTMAESLSVAIASDQSAVPVSATQLPAVLGVTTMAQSLSIGLASDDTLHTRITDLNADIGNTTDAAVKDATGSVNAHLRGISTQLPQVLGATTAAQSLSVALASDDLAVTALQILDDWDESDRAKINPIVGQAGVAAGAGVVGVTVQRTTLASDDPAVTALQVMDDWDETNRAAVNPVVGQAGLAAGTGVDAVNALRVSLATNVALPAGTSLLGKVGIDQTTPGTTESVTVATAQGAGATIGTTADASVPTDASGTLSGKLRGVVANLVATLTRLGVAADAAVITDADGSLHAKARGIVALLAPAATIANAQVSVGIASQEIVATRAGRRSLGIRNLGTAAEKVYLGAGTVTNANGFLIEAGESIEVLDCTAAVNGIADGTTVSCSYLEVY